MSIKNTLISWGVEPRNPAIVIKWHVPCASTDGGAHPDLNRWVAMGRPKA